MENLIVLVGFGKEYKKFIPYYLCCIIYNNINTDVLVFTDNSSVEGFNESMEFI